MKTAKRQFIFNSFHAGKRVQTIGSNLKIVKNVRILEFHYHIWNQRDKCFQISTNMPSIGLIILEIAFEILEF